ncbi:MAG: hypothetical protein FI719_07875 [SAR202 cluster bacterium]|nr:hypothetical protein [SAR202 cluster bacterium]
MFKPYKKTDKGRKMTPTRFPELSVSGSPTQMGQDIGEHFKTQIHEVTELVLDRVNKGTLHQISWEQAENAARYSFHRAEDFFPDIMDELRGTAIASNVSLERLMVLNSRNMLTFTKDGCTSIMVSDQASASGIGFAGQNWDNDPAMAPFSAVITRKGTGKTAFTSWLQPGIVAYMGFNSAGVGVCMNALNGPTDSKGLPWYFLVRCILESESSEHAIKQISSAPRALTANAAMITTAGPLNLEITPDSLASLQEENNGMLVHTNHCLHPSLISNNELFANRIYGQSFARKNRAQALLENKAIDGKVSIDDAQDLLSDHEQFPTSICRHPNDDSETGWQRSVISIIVEPSLRQMHVSNGNPCKNPYETYHMK